MNSTKARIWQVGSVSFARALTSNTACRIDLQEREGAVKYTIKYLQSLEVWLQLKVLRIEHVDESVRGGMIITTLLLSPSLQAHYLDVLI